MIAIALIAALPCGVPSVREIACLPARHERMALCAVRMGDRLALVGGYAYQQRTCLSSVSSIDANGREVEAIPMHLDRNFAIATALDDHRFVVAGGYSERDETRHEVECVDLKQGTTTAWGSLFEPAELATGERIGGKFTLIGGLTSQGETKTLSCLQSIDLAREECFLEPCLLATSRFGHGSITLPSGSVVIIGGKHVDRMPRKTGGSAAVYRPLSSIEIWNPSRRTVEPGGVLQMPRDRPALALDRRGRVWVLGGKSETRVLNSIERYDPVTHRSVIVARMHAPRMGAVLLPYLDRGVFISGGWTDDPSRARAIEFLDFRTGALSVVGQARFSRAEHAMVWLHPGVFALVGGKDAFVGRAPSSYRFAKTEIFEVTASECTTRGVPGKKGGA